MSARLVLELFGTKKRLDTIGPYQDTGGEPRRIIVRAGAVVQRGGDPCGRPGVRSSILLSVFCIIKQSSEELKELP